MYLTAERVCTRKESGILYLMLHLELGTSLELWKAFPSSSKDMIQSNHHFRFYMCVYSNTPSDQMGRPTQLVKATRPGSLQLSKRSDLTNRCSPRSAKVFTKTAM